ncbi:DUF4440 domain-containing protein [Mycobacteroides chelonae]|uniref:DUF4440 domain-containing protein n=1 Tax=Mycobacteroides chelonae TaxID=1774 RepID=A0A1S1LYJ5_MYCCH|nr:ester cyclase family protein [Mycobacteroides chelonae]OHU28263.1 DUF4440 domain-containing protein [Mycobacteroides chelonae]OHU63690.1 DUF4440 domain-containing protein [Mycobacteroides chelonae]OHU76421.1 DUF4440 domain-containing protein [Mycobacteroides chelonae]QQG88322.1 ester cyclase [Mycobacteroides chelonae]QQG93139.1 ester cyclase [Mycobacteroides chelonae]
MTEPGPDPQSRLYRRFLELFNAGRYEDLSTVVDERFIAHHAGFGNTHTLSAYIDSLRTAREALELRAELDYVAAFDDRVITRCRLLGRHVGTFLGYAPTGRAVTWETLEIWRVASGKFVERWSQDDLYGLSQQLSPDGANVALIKRLNDVVNERRYGDMDALFSAEFVDHNPAWSARNLDELKDIISSAHKALDFTSNQDLIYPADGGKVVIHITFTGRHVGPFLGRQPTGRAVSWTSIEVYQLSDGLIAERWVQADTAGLMKQLGVPLPGA